MNEPDGERNPVAHRVDELVVSLDAADPRDTALVQQGAQSLVVHAEPLDQNTVSRHGPLGRIAKRVVARLIRFYTHRQDHINRDHGDELARLRARLTVVEFTVQQRFARIEEDQALLRRDVAEIVERLTVFENVRRIVARLAPFRTEVRSHRRELVELRAQLASLSVRLTLGQRELAPVRHDVEQFRRELDEIAATNLANRLVALDASLANARADLAAITDALNERVDAAFAALQREQTALSGSLAEQAARVGSALGELERIDLAVERQHQELGRLNALDAADPESPAPESV
jgi:chromosome segregation ATPase